MLDLSKNPISSDLLEQTSSAQLTRADAWQLRILSSTWAVPIAVSSFWMVLIVVIHRNSPRTLVSFHGLLHAAIAGAFSNLSVTSIPPENPFYAGEPLPYYWFFHFLGAQITRLLGLNIFHSFELLVIVATGALMVTAVVFGRRLYRNTISGILIGYLIMAGTNPLGWAHAINNIVRGESGALKDNPDHLWGVVHPIYSLIRYNDVGGIYGPLLNFFLNITSRPLALATLMGMLFSLHRMLQRRRSSAIVGLVVTSAATTAFSPIIGIAAGGSLIGGLVLVWWRNRRTPSLNDADVSRRPFFASLAIALGIVVALPTYYHLVVGSASGGTQFILFSLAGLRQIVGVTLSVFVLLGLSLLGWYRAPREHRGFLATLICSALPLIGFTMAFSMMSGNESNLFHAAVVLLAVPAAASILRTDPSGLHSLARNRFSAGVFLIFLPTTLLLVSSYVNRPPLPVSFNSTEIIRTPDDADQSRLYKWVKSETEPRAVFILDPRERVTVCGNTAEFPAMTGRAMFTEDKDHYLTKPYPDAAVRVSLASRLVSGEVPRESDWVYLAKLNRPMYVASYHVQGTDLLSRMQENYGPPVFTSATIAVFKLPETKSDRFSENGSSKFLRLAP